MSLQTVNINIKRSLEQVTDAQLKGILMLRQELGPSIVNVSFEGGAFGLCYQDHAMDIVINGSFSEEHLTRIYTVFQNSCIVPHTESYEKFTSADSHNVSYELKAKVSGEEIFEVAEKYLYQAKEIGTEGLNYVNQKWNKAYGFFQAAIFGNNPEPETREEVKVSDLIPEGMKNLATIQLKDGALLENSKDEKDINKGSIRVRALSLEGLKARIEQIVEKGSFDNLVGYCYEVEGEICIKNFTIESNNLLTDSSYIDSLTEKLASMSSWETVES